MSFEVDEIVPVSKGGSPIDPGNVAPAHRICNERRGNRTPPQLADPPRAGRAPSAGGSGEPLPVPTATEGAIRAAVAHGPRPLDLGCLTSRRWRGVGGAPPRPPDGSPEGIAPFFLTRTQLTQLHEEGGCPDGESQKTHRLRAEVDRLDVPPARGHRDRPPSRLLKVDRAARLGRRRRGRGGCPGGLPRRVPARRARDDRREARGVARDAARRAQRRAAAGGGGARSRVPRDHRGDRQIGGRRWR